MPLLYPLLAQILWTFIVMAFAGRARINSLRQSNSKPHAIALSAEGWANDARAAGNNMNNQFETPVLFYVLCLIAMMLGATGQLMAVLAWGYLASRILHSLFHVTSNNLVQRFSAFAAGYVCLIGLWVGVTLAAMRHL